jgi:acetolactate synthase-1/2/3 large subunit
MRASEAVVQCLQELGVQHIFGLCGDTTLPLYEALHDGDHGIRHILTRDERSASFMADAYARFSGRVGVCEGPSGGGAMYLVPGVAEANGSSVPLVCLTTDIDLRAAGRGVLTELDQSRLFAPITKWRAMPHHGHQVPAAIREAFRQASTGGLGATHIVLGQDVQLTEVDSGDVYADPCCNSYPSQRTPPERDGLSRAAGLLVEAQQPLIVAGAGVLRSGAWDELRDLAYLLGAPVATSIGGKGSIAETDPYSLGVIGSNGGLPYRHQQVQGSDVIVYVGCRQSSVTTEKWSLPRDGEKTLIQLDVDPAVIGKNYRTAVGIVADAKLGLAALQGEVDRRLSGRPAGKVDPDYIARRCQEHLDGVDEFQSDHTPIRPERFLTELFRVLPHLIQKPIPRSEHPAPPE